jgi:pantetheine-phosphate adenylyltransferase
VDVARRASKLFDHLIVAVYDRPSKRMLFTPEERMELFRASVRDLPNVEVRGYSGLTVDFARRLQAAALVRGLRATSDFEYEYQMTTMNRHLQPAIETVFLMTSVAHAYLSSSLIKEVAAEGAVLDGLVEPHVAGALRAKFASKDA